MAFHGYKYERIPTPLSLRIYYEKLLDWHIKYADGKTSADAKFEDEFNERIAQATEVNAKNNKNKSAYLYRCNTALAIALVGLALSAIPFLIATISKGDPVYQVRIMANSILNHEESIMSDPKPEVPVPVNPLSNKALPEPLPEPTMPRNDTVTEHVIKPMSETFIIEQSD